MSAPARGAIHGIALIRSALLRGVCNVASLLPGGGGPALSAPTNLVPPSISGTATQGNTLTVTPGSWTGNPVPSVSRLWKLNGASTGQVGLTYNLTLADVGGTITVTETATNSQGTASVTSSGVGPIASSGGGSGITAPTLARTSTAGASPLTMSATFDATAEAGDFIHLQVDNNSDFSSPEQDLTQIIDGSSWTAGDMTLTGFITPTSNVQYWARCRVERDDGSFSAWSNVITDTILSSTAALVQTTGVDKSQYVTMDSAFQAHITAGNSTNAANNVRATIPQQNNLGHFEVKIDVIDAIASPNGSIACGLADSGSVTAFGASAFPEPGTTGKPGLEVLTKWNSSTATVKVNAGTSGKAIKNAAAASVNPGAGDIIGVDYNMTTHVVHLRYFFADSANAGANAFDNDWGTFTLTGANIPATPYAFLGLWLNGDKATINFGASAFHFTPDGTFYG